MKNPDSVRECSASNSIPKVLNGLNPSTCCWAKKRDWQVADFWARQNRKLRKLFHPSHRAWSWVSFKVPTGQQTLRRRNCSNSLISTTKFLWTVEDRAKPALLRKAETTVRWTTTRAVQSHSRSPSWSRWQHSPLGKISIRWKQPHSRPTWQWTRPSRSSRIREPVF
jgi:hypothetical protein